VTCPPAATRAALLAAVRDAAVDLGGILGAGAAADPRIEGWTTLGGDDDDDDPDWPGFDVVVALSTPAGPESDLLRAACAVAGEFWGARGVAPGGGELSPTVRVLRESSFLLGLGGGDRGGRGGVGR